MNVKLSNLTSEDLETIVTALKVADKLCTSVFTGAPGTQAKALEFARVMDDLKRRKIVVNA